MQRLDVDYWRLDSARQRLDANFRHLDADFWRLDAAQQSLDANFWRRPATTSQSLT
jgi:hypothetical protein